jgi:hypothetical protein
MRREVRGERIKFMIIIIDHKEVFLVPYTLKNNVAFTMLMEPVANLLQVFFVIFLIFSLYLRK